jgi:hypothetical protein
MPHLRMKIQISNTTECALRWGRDDRSPATRALLDIWVVALRVVTIVPIERGRRGSSRRGRFDIDRSRGRHDHRGVGIGSPVRSPIRSNPEEPMVPSESMMASESMVPTKPVSTPSGVPWPHAGHKQHRHQPDDPHPRVVCASAMVLLTHRDSLPRLPACPGRRHR